MPSISFMDSRQRSKATSTHASNLLRQQSVQSSTPAPTTETGGRTTASSRSSEEVMSSASSPDSSAEDGPDSDDDDILDDDDDQETADSGYGQSFPVKQEHTSASVPVPPPSMGERRTSFGTTTALMGRMGLGSLPLRSPVAGVDNSLALASTSPRYGASSLSAGGPVINYSTSPNGNAGVYHHGTPLGTSPHLPMPSSSLRGGAVDEEEEDDEEMRSERERSRGAKEGSEEEGDWNTMDMEM